MSKSVRRFSDAYKEMLRRRPELSMVMPPTQPDREREDVRKAALYMKGWVDGYMRAGGTNLENDATEACEVVGENLRHEHQK